MRRRRQDRSESSKLSRTLDTHLTLERSPETVNDPEPEFSTDGGRVRGLSTGRELRLRAVVRAAQAPRRGQRMQP
jgi:hypothetical protein